MRRALIVAGFVVVAAGAIGLAYGSRFALLTRMIFTHAPHTPFDQMTPPPAPDYSQRASWGAMPGTQDPTNVAPPGVAKADPATAPADVFFIHPTSFFDSDQWNQPLSDETTNRQTDTGTLRAQASVFNGCCRIYAPRYRQMTLGGFVGYSKSSDEALALAYSDVKRAFDYYIAHYNRGRPFIIASHSQGSRHAVILLADAIDGTDLRKRFVAAYIAGTWIPESRFARLKTIKPCERADDTGCVLTWSTLADGSDAQAQRVAFARRSGLPASLADEKFVCTNPISWTRSTALAPASLNLGGWLPGESDPPRAIDPNIVSARCDDGALFVSRPDSFLYRIGRLPGGNYHNYDYQLFWMNIRKNAQTRVQAFLANQH
jgi:hypothetical protein